MRGLRIRRLLNDGRLLLRIGGLRRRTIRGRLRRAVLLLRGRCVRLCLGWRWLKARRMLHRRWRVSRWGRAEPRRGLLLWPHRRPIRIQAVGRAEAKALIRIGIAIAGVARRRIAGRRLLRRGCSRRRSITRRPPRAGRRGRRWRRRRRRRCTRRCRRQRSPAREAELARGLISGGAPGALNHRNRSRDEHRRSFDREQARPLWNFRGPPADWAGQALDVGVYAPNAERSPRSAVFFVLNAGGLTGQVA